MELKERLQKFLHEVGVPVTVVCRKINLSTRAIYYWKNGQLNLSEPVMQRLDGYLSHYGH